MKDSQKLMYQCQQFRRKHCDHYNSFSGKYHGWTDRLELQLICDFLSRSVHIINGNEIEIIEPCFSNENSLDKSLIPIELHQLSLIKNSTKNEFHFKDSDKHVRVSLRIYHFY